MIGLFLLTLSAQSTSGAAPSVRPAPAPQSAKAVGPHFQVEARFGSQLAADQALAAAEWTVAPIESVYGKAPASTAAHLPRIVLYSSAADYDAQKLVPFPSCFPGTEPTFLAGAPHPSFHDRASRAGHVLVEPEWAADRLAALGLPMQTRVVVAREAARLLTDSIVADPAALASWYEEGAAQWAAEEGFAAAGWIQDRMDEPSLARQARIARALANNSSQPWLSQIVPGWLLGLTAEERPAVYGAVFRFLKDPARKEVFARLSVPARSNAAAGGGEKALRDALGEDDACLALEQAFVAYCSSLEPKWIEATPALTTSGTSWLQVASPDANAMAWRVEQPGSKRYSIQGEVEILQGNKQQMNVLLAGVDEGFVQVSFVAGYGIDVFRFDKVVDVADHEIQSADHWLKLATVEVKGLETGRSIPFQVVVQDEALTVSIGGQPACAARIEAETALGRWGLGALAGSAGRWRKIAFGRL